MTAGGRDTLIFASRRSPFPLVNGARIRSHRLLTGLARHFDVKLLTFEHHPDSADGHCGREELVARLDGIEVHTVPGLGPRRRLQQAGSLLGRSSWVFGRYRLPAYGEALRELVRDCSPAVVHFDDAGVGQFGPVPGVFSPLALSDVEHRITQQTARSAGGLRGAFARIEAPRVRRDEQLLWRRMPLCLAASELDAEAMRAGGVRRVELCPNGTDPVDQLPLRSRAEGEPLRILFVGSGSYLPYERGLAWLIQRVLPGLRARFPVELDVVGRPPLRPIQADGVEYAGEVPSVASWYERAHVLAVPVFEGSGTRLKIIEAAAYGRPVVSTRLGAEGLPVRAGEHYFESDDEEGWIEALSGLARRLEDPDAELGRMLDHARMAVTPLFWPRIVDELAELYRAALRERPNR